MNRNQLSLICLVLFGLVFSVVVSEDVNETTTTTTANTTVVTTTTTTTEETTAPPKYIVTDEVWFEIGIKDTPESEPTKKGKVVIALFGDIVPMTVTNFKQLAKGFKRDRNIYTYKGTSIHRVVKDFVIQGGDFLHGDGTGSKSIYGDKFIDENFILSHRSPGWVSMANYGKDTNGSQFFITLVPSRWLDGHHVAFGRVLSGMAFVKEISELDTFKGSSLPKKHVEILDAGVNTINRYELSEDQIDNSADIRPQ